MKVKFTDFEAAVITFLKKVIDTMPTTGHKFAAGAMLTASAKKMEDVLSAYADKDGCIDTSEVRRIVHDGVSYSGDKVSFAIGDDRLSWLLKPVTVTITESDVDSALTDLESRVRTA